jgi:hypothetical protein
MARIEFHHKAQSGRGGRHLAGRQGDEDQAGQALEQEVGCAQEGIKPLGGCALLLPTCEHTGNHAFGEHVGPSNIGRIQPKSPNIGNLQDKTRGPWWRQVRFEAPALFEATSSDIFSKLLWTGRIVQILSWRPVNLNTSVGMENNSRSVACLP